MTWTVTREDVDGETSGKPVPPKLNVRAVIDLDNEQHEIKELIASLQKHVKE